MTTELQDKLTKTFPWFDVYIECGDGWFTLIWNMCMEIDDLYFDADREVDVKILQVKEKWAELRVYHDSWDEAVNNIVDKYCDASEYTCELCGEIGRGISKYSYGMVRCEECEKGE